MPGFLSVQNAFANTLKISFRFSRFIDEIAQAIREDAIFETSDGTARDPTYITRDADGNVKKFWRTTEDGARIKKYEQYASILTKGMRELRPSWYREREGTTENQTKYQAYDFLTLISQAQTDLLAGGGITVKTGIEKMDTLFNDDLKFGEKFYQWLFESSVFGFVGVQIVVDKELGTLQLDRVLPQFLYVKFSESVDNEWIAISKKIKVDKEQIRDRDKLRSLSLSGYDAFVFEERHFKGWYENYLWAVKGDEIVGEVPLEMYKPTLKRVVVTGLQDFAIVIIPNKIVLGNFISEWDNIIDHNLNFNDRASREGELLNKYAGPQLMVSESQITYDPSTGKVFHRVPREGAILVRPQDNFTPSYLQPQADIEGSANNRDFIRGMIATESQTSPILLNADAANEVESGVSYKLKLTPTLIKVKRRQPQVRASAQRLVFLVLAAIDYYSDFKIAEHVVEEARREGASEKLRLRATSVQKYIKSNITKISMASFDEHFSKIEVLAEAPLGLFLEDPALAASQEELQYLLTLNQIQEIENRRVAMQAILQQKDISIQMLPSLPQDVAQAIERLAGKASLSVQTFLTEVDGRTEDEAASEVKRIQEEEELLGSASPFGTGITMPDDIPVQDLGNQMSGPQSIQPGEPLPNEFDSSDLATAETR